MRKKKCQRCQRCEFNDATMTLVIFKKRRGKTVSVRRELCYRCWVKESKAA